MAYRAIFTFMAHEGPPLVETGRQRDGRTQKHTAEKNTHTHTKKKKKKKKKTATFLQRIQHYLVIQRAHYMNVVPLER